MSQKTKRVSWDLDPAKVDFCYWRNLTVWSYLLSHHDSKGRKAGALGPPTMIAKDRKVNWNFWMQQEHQITVLISHVLQMKTLSALNLKLCGSLCLLTATHKLWPESKQFSTETQIRKISSCFWCLSTRIENWMDGKIDTWNGIKLTWIDNVSDL